MKLYLLDWDNGMTGGFRGDNFEQVFNTDNELLGWSIKHFMEMYDFKTIEIGFLESRKELNKLRVSNGFKAKSTLDTYLKENNIV
jgi:hypothetical protein